MIFLFSNSFQTTMDKLLDNLLAYKGNNYFGCLEGKAYDQKTNTLTLDNDKKYKYVRSSHNSDLQIWKDVENDEEYGFMFGLNFDEALLEGEFTYLHKLEGLNMPENVERDANDLAQWIVDNGAVPADNIKISDKLIE